MGELLLDFSSHPLCWYFPFTYFPSNFFLPCAQKRSGPCINFPFFLLSNLSMSSALSLIYLFWSTIFALSCHFLVAFLFPPTYRGPSVPSLHLLIYPWFSGRSDSFQLCCICFMGTLFWSFVGPFWTHLLIYNLMNVVMSVVYLYVRYLPLTCLKRHFSFSSSAHPQIWYRVLIFHCMCNF